MLSQIVRFRPASAARVGQNRGFGWLQMFRPAAAVPAAPTPELPPPLEPHQAGTTTSGFITALLSHNFLTLAVRGRNVFVCGPPQRVDLIAGHREGEALQIRMRDSFWEAHPSSRDILRRTSRDDISLPLGELQLGLADDSVPAVVNAMVSTLAGVPAPPGLRRQQSVYAVVRRWGKYSRLELIVRGRVAFSLASPESIKVIQVDAAKDKVCILWGLDCEPPILVSPTDCGLPDMRTVELVDVLASAVHRG